MAKRLTINLKTFQEFVRSGQIGGIILLFCVIISLIIANSGLGESFQRILDQQIGYQTSGLNLRYSISLWINDGLMAFFFLLVGLEIKREILEGELSSPKRAALPIVAALGGMIVPALIYVLFNSGTSTAGGWGIPMATDIAFALAIISLLGKKVPSSLKIFLAALAIVDDLGAIVVIALFYTAELHWNYLLYSGGVLLFLASLNYLNVKNLIFYLIPGIFLWYFIHHSGIHATIAGVLLALTVPTNPVKDASPLEKLEHILSTPVNYIIMPLFALANTNIRFENGMIEGLNSPMSLGVMLGLALGKPIGVTLFSWAAVKLKFSSMPSRANWNHMIGTGMLAGIGFTMSIFISLLSFSDTEHQTEAKFCILIASVFSGIAGYTFLNFLNKKKVEIITRMRSGHFVRKSRQL